MLNEVRKFLSISKNPCINIPGIKDHMYFEEIADTVGSCPSAIKNWPENINIGDIKMYAPTRTILALQR